MHVLTPTILTRSSISLASLRRVPWVLFQTVGLHSFNTAPIAPSVNRVSRRFFAKKKDTMPPKKKDDSDVLAGAARFSRSKNTLQMGICGLPNVGKSSTFNLLTEQSVPAENFPFCTIKPSLSRVALPDERYDLLCEQYVLFYPYRAV